MGRQLGVITVFYGTTPTDTDKNLMNISIYINIKKQTFYLLSDKFKSTKGINSKAAVRLLKKQHN